MSAPSTPYVPDPYTAAQLEGLDEAWLWPSIPMPAGPRAIEPPPVWMGGPTPGRLPDLTPYEGLIFDMDGTLVDNMDVHNECWVRWAHAAGLPHTREQIMGLVHGTLKDIIPRFFPDGDEALWQAQGQRKEAMYRRVYGPHLRAIEGLAAYLAGARARGLRLALATAGDGPNIRFTLERLATQGLPEGTFEAVVSGTDVRHGKPDPEVFLLAAERLGIAPARCLVYEDSPAGAEAAARAGMDCVIVNPFLPADAYEGRGTTAIAWVSTYAEAR